MVIFRIIRKILISIIAGIMVLLGLFYLILFVVSFSIPTPTKPKINKTEIDFSLTYEINGQERYYSDSLVCKFDGMNITSGGKFREYKSWYKSKPDNDEIILYDIDDVYCITLGVGTPDYFLSDPHVDYIPENPYIVIFNRSTGYYITGTQEEKEMLSSVGFKIIDWQCEEPIENIFS